MEDYQADSQGNAMTLTYPVDVSGRRVGTYDQWPAQNWTGWDVYWSRVAGQHISMGGAHSWLAHSDAIDSTTMVTDETGAVVWDQVFGPWGHVWQQTGTRPWFVFAGLRWPVNDPLHPSATREYNFRVYRWMTPDPGGRKVIKLDDPQTWNMYAYVGNNPTSLNDPGGLQSNCATGGGCSSNGDSFEEDSMHFSDGRYGLEETITDAPPGAQQQSGGWFHNLVASAVAWAAANGHPVIAGFLTRYMGTEEASKAADEHMIPNTDRLGNPKDVYFTRDEPLNDAKAAQEKYTLPKTPTHRATVPEERVPNPRVPEAGPMTEGGGSQVITDEPVPVFPGEVVPLDPAVPVDPIIIEPIP